MSTNVKKLPSGTVRVTILPEHIKLLQSMYWEWNQDEYGAPGVDPKRPFGNSWVIGDLREILPGLDDDTLEELYRETDTVFQCCLSRLSFSLGTFERVGYGGKVWNEIPLTHEEEAEECLNRR